MSLISGVLGRPGVEICRAVYLIDKGILTESGQQDTSRGDNKSGMGISIVPRVTQYKPRGDLRHPINHICAGLTDIETEIGSMNPSPEYLSRPLQFSRS